MKKIITIFITVLMLFVFAGCDSKEEDTNSDIANENIEPKKEKTADELAVELLEAENVDMSAYGVNDSSRFKKVSAKKLFELMNIKEGEKEYNFFFAKPNAYFCSEAAQMCEGIAEELNIIIFYVDASEFENDEYYDKYMESFGTYSGDEYCIPYSVKICDGVVAGYIFIDQYKTEIFYDEMKTIFEKLPQDYIDEVIIPKANGTWEW